MNLKNNGFYPEELKLPLLTILDLEEYASFHKIRKGQDIFYEGHIPYGIYILQAGKIKIVSDSCTQIIKAPYILEIKNFLKNIPYQGTATALQDSEVAFISRSGFQNLLKKYGNLLFLNNKEI